MIQRDPERRLKQKLSQRRCRLRRKGDTSDIARKTINQSGDSVAITSSLTTTAAQCVQTSHADSDTVASETLKHVAPSEGELRLDSSREDVTPGVSSFVDAHMSASEVSTADSGRGKKRILPMQDHHRVGVGLLIRKEGCFSKCGCKADEELIAHASVTSLE